MSYRYEKITIKVTYYTYNCGSCGTKTTTSYPHHCKNHGRVCFKCRGHYDHCPTCWEGMSPEARNRARKEYTVAAWKGIGFFTLLFAPMMLFVVGGILGLFGPDRDVSLAVGIVGMVGWVMAFVLIALRKQLREEIRRAHEHRERQKAGPKQKRKPMPLGAKIALIVLPSAAALIIVLGIVLMAQFEARWG
jgi:hypothetical protein